MLISFMMSWRSESTGTCLIARSCPDSLCTALNTAPYALIREHHNSISPKQVQHSSEHGRIPKNGQLWFDYCSETFTTQCRTRGWSTRDSQSIGTRDTSQHGLLHRQDLYFDTHTLMCESWIYTSIFGHNRHEDTTQVTQGAVNWLTTLQN